MEPRIPGLGQLRSEAEEALVLARASGEERLAGALRRLTNNLPSPLCVHTLGDELVLAVGSYPLLSVNLERGSLRVWNDWRERVAAAAKEAASGVAKRLVAMLLDRGDEIPSQYREELRGLASAIERGEGSELQARLEELLEVLRAVSGGEGAALL